MRGRIVIVGSVLVVVAAVAAVYQATFVRASDDRPLPALVVEATSRAATAWEIFSHVAEPIENEIDGVENLLQLRSECFDGGKYRLTLVFRRDTNLNEAQAAVRPRLERGAANLSAEFKNSIQVRPDVVAAHAPKRSNATADRVPMRFAVQDLDELTSDPRDQTIRLMRLGARAFGLAGALMTTRGLIEVEVSPTAEVKYIRFKFDDARARQLGVSEKQFDDTLRAAFGRAKQIEWNEFNKQPSLTVPTPSGNSVSFSDFTSWITTQEPAVIERFNRRLSLTISLQLAPDVSPGEARERIERRLQATQRDDYRLAWIDEPH